LNEIGQLIIGKNPGWKQSINIGKKNNQAFTNIPHAQLISLLTYKAQVAGIVVTLTEESYTSQASALDGDNLPTYNKKTEAKPVFSGKRVQCGLYRGSTGKIINADTNGSINIARKVIPDFMKGIEGLPFIPVVLGLWTKILTLPDLKVRGFLIQRLTFKCCVLSAIFRPFNRRKLPIQEPDSQPPQRVYLQKHTLDIYKRVWVCPTLLNNFKRIVFFNWFKV